MDFLNNKGLADRINEFPNLANIEQHLSYYTYTVTIDLSKIGKDGKIELPNEEKQRRVIELLEIIKVLNRDIRGRQENLSPLFIIGGTYELNTPYFLGRIKLENKDDEFNINTNALKDTMKLKIGENTVEKDTKIGIVKDIFKNEQELENMLPENTYDVQTFFEKLEDEVKEYYK